jgi:ectoine hydroxylase-related dioxygenase (phytanoyl-CoA dioxygenase family)
MNFDYYSYKVPFVESPFLEKMLQSKKSKYTDYIKSLNKDGYCIIDLELDESLIDQANKDVENVVKEKSFKTNSEAYHYNDSPRIVEGWLFSDSIKKIALNKKLNDILQFAYQSEPIPFSTINFLKGTEQPLHSDEFHFGSIPHGYLSGAWIALEDIHVDAGPLSIAKKSHKLPLFSFEKIGVSIPRNESDFKKGYTLYEEWVKEMIECNSLEIITPKLKKGQCLIWLANLLHGSYKIKDNSLSRRSLVVHFHYSACKTIFFPSHSNLEKAKFIPRRLADLNIRNK